MDMKPPKRLRYFYPADRFLLRCVGDPRNRRTLHSFVGPGSAARAPRLRVKDPHLGGDPWSAFTNESWQCGANSQYDSTSTYAQSTARLASFVQNSVV